MFSVENAKSKHHQWILLIQISLGSKVQLKLTILIFWTKFDQKGYFRSKTKKQTPSMNFAYLNYSRYQISGETDNFWFLGPNLTKKDTSGLKQKSEHHQWILHIWITLGIKSQVKLTSFDFLDTLCPKRVFPVSNRKFCMRGWSLLTKLNFST